MSNPTTITDKVEQEIQRTNLRPQRPPPPPPIVSEPSSPTDLLTTSSESTSSYAQSTSEPTTNNNTENRTSSLLSQFTQLFDEFKYETVRRQILTRELISSPFTSVLWRIFLHCLPRTSSQWDITIDISREHFEELSAKYDSDPQMAKKLDGEHKHYNHPLSQEENSPWCQFYQYKDLKENINQDVQRTCQDIPFFRQTHILDLLLKVLYIHGRHYEKTIPYRQGMHEILAVIIYLIHNESVQVNEYSESNELMKKLYDPKYLAHDSFAIYEKILEHLQRYYDFKPGNTPRRKSMLTQEKTQAIFQKSLTASLSTSDIVSEVQKIYERLYLFEPHLYQKLEELSIEPTIYGLRWLRLLFGREIPFDSIPTLWTVIFCYDECFQFVDYVFLAFLKNIGKLFEKVNAAEYSFCLQYLMRPNVIKDVEKVIRKALSYERMQQQRRSYPMIPIDSPRVFSLSVNPLENCSSNPAKLNTVGKLATSDANDVSEQQELIVSPNKENLLRLEDNTEMQKGCAKYMYLFIQNIRKYLGREPNSIDEEVLLQLNGLEQIAQTLDGVVPLDEDSLQTHLKYNCEEKLDTNDDM